MSLSQIAFGTPDAWEGDPAATADLSIPNVEATRRALQQTVWRLRSRMLWSSSEPRARRIADSQISMAAVRHAVLLGARQHSNGEADYFYVEID